MPNRPYILSRTFLSPTARLLAAELGIQRSNIVRNYPPLIRWGNSDGEFENDTDLNLPEIIRICSNKLDFSRNLESLGIPHIPIYRGIPTRFPIVVRQNLSASRGIGIVVCKNLEEFNNTPRNQFWSLWYNFRYELGVHLLGGKIVKVMKKVRDENLPDEEFPIKNSNRGYHFKSVRIENFKSLTPLMENIYNKFSMQFGRWDVGFDEDSKCYRVIESNSAPGLSENENTLNKYLEFFSDIFHL